VSAYRHWALETIERERPTCLVFSHGEPLVAADLPERLRRLVKETTF
jgi:hypothetical protein